MAEALAPRIFEAFAAAGTTTVLAYGVVFEAAMDASFRAAEAHGIRAILGKVMMDRGTYDPVIEPATILDRSLRESADLIARWHGRDDGRLGYAVTPRFAVSCTTDMLRESAALAAATGAWWQSHVAEDPFEIAEVGRLFPDALDYVDVYDRAGALGERSVLAHAIHLSDRELGRLVETGTRVAHCPASNLFIGAGVMPLARWLQAGCSVGLGSDVSGGPDASLFSVMRVGAYTQMALPIARRGRRRHPRAARLAADGDARRCAGARAGGPDRLPGVRQGGRPDRRRPGVRGAAARQRGGCDRCGSRRPREPPHLPRAPGHGQGRLGPRTPIGRSGRSIRVG